MTLTLPSPCSWASGASDGCQVRLGSSANAVPAPAGERESRPELAVERVARRREQREGVGAAVEEDRDEHLLLRPCRRGCRDALVEHAGAAAPTPP